MNEKEILRVAVKIIEKNKPFRKDTRQLTIAQSTYDPEGNDPCPMIRLKGKWLEKAGFAIGDKVNLIVKEKAITIYKDDGKGIQLKF